MTDKTIQHYICVFEGKGAPEPFSAVCLASIFRFLKKDIGGTGFLTSRNDDNSFYQIEWCDSVSGDHVINCYLQENIHGI